MASCPAMESAALSSLSISSSSASASWCMRGGGAKGNDHLSVRARPRIGEGEPSTWRHVAASEAGACTPGRFSCGSSSRHAPSGDGERRRKRSCSFCHLRQQTWRGESRGRGVADATSGRGTPLVGRHCSMPPPKRSVWPAQRRAMGDGGGGGGGGGRKGVGFGFPLASDVPAAATRSSSDNVGEEQDEGREAGSSKDTKGAGMSWISPDWLTSLIQGGLSVLRGVDKSGIPVANAKLDDVRDLLGGALFLPLFKWMLESGPVYRLAAGPRNFVVIGEPQAAKHVLRNYGTYGKGLVSEVSEFLFGSGFAIAEGEIWTVRRRAVVPALHRKYLETMVDRVFGSCAQRLVQKLDQVAKDGRAVDMESCLSQLTLDVIGQAVFNFDFDALQQDNPLIQAVYTSLKETESRATDIIPYWQSPLLCQLVPRQRKAAEAVVLIRATVEDLVAKCKAMVEAEEEERGVDEDYVNESDPSVLRFLLQSREEVSSQQLRDDLLSMLVAGHETTGSVLTWTVYLLVKNQAAMAKVKEEVDRVIGDRNPTLEDTKALKYLTRCINESMRLYPHPPILIRRSKEPDVLPGGYKINAGQDIMISVYNIHHSPQVWEDAEEFIPERFDLDAPVPNEANMDFRYIPFSGGPRKCVGDQFAMLEAIVALAILFQNLEFELVPDQAIGMTTGATIHTTTGLYMTMKRREKTAVAPAAEFVLV